MTLSVRAPALRQLPFGLAALVVLLGLGFMLHQALAIRLHYYDTYDYLNDARRLNGDRSAAYYEVHSPFVPVLTMPVEAAIVDVEPADAPFRWVLPHLLGALFAALMLLVSFAWMRRRVGSRWALLGVVLLVGTRLFIRYSPFLLADIASAGWVVAAFLAWDRATVGGRWRDYALFGVAIAGAISTKYSAMLLPTAFAGAELVRIVIERKLRWRRIAGGLLGAVVAAATFWGFMSAVFTRVDGRTFTIDRLIELLSASSTAVAALPHERVWDYAPMLVSCVSVITLVAAVLGAASGLRRQWRKDLPAALFVVIFVGVLSFRVGHNEARYLWPALPAMVYFAVIGARASWMRWCTWPSGEARAAGTACMVGLVGVALTPGVRQVIRDTDPFFYTPTQPRAVRFIQDHTTGERRVFWSGHFVALTPPNPKTELPQDEFFNYFHFAHPCVHMMTDAHVRGVNEADPVAFLRREPGEGDVFVVGPSYFAFGQVPVQDPRTFEMYARRRLTLHRERDAYVDETGRAWLRVERGELVALEDLGETDLSAVTPAGSVLPLGRYTLHRGGIASGATPTGQLQLVSVLRRELPASFGVDPPR